MKGFRFPHFTLKTFLLCIAATALLLGWYAERAASQYRLRVRLLECGGAVEYDDGFGSDMFPKPRPTYDESRILFDWRHSIKLVCLPGCCGDVFIKEFVAFPQLESLHLKEREINHVDFLWIGRSNLKYLTLERCRFSLDDLAHSMTSNIAYVTADEASITDSDLVALRSRFPRIEFHRSIPVPQS